MRSHEQVFQYIGTSPEPVITSPSSVTPAERFWFIIEQLLKMVLVNFCVEPPVRRGLVKPRQFELRCIEDVERTADSGWLLSVRGAIDLSPTVGSRLHDDEYILRCAVDDPGHRLKRAGRGLEMSVFDGPSNGAGRLAAAHGARSVLHPWEGGA